MVVQSRDVHVVYADTPLRGAIESAKEAQEGAFAATTFTYDACELAVLDGEGHVLDGSDFASCLAKLFLQILYD